MRTLRERVKNKEIAGAYIDQKGRHYVDLDEFDRVNRLSSQLEDRRRQLLASPELEGLV
jgi:hypothetical protein